MSSVAPDRPNPTASLQPIDLPSIPATPSTATQEDKDLRELLHLIGQVAPHFAQAASKNAEQETIRHKNALKLWSLPFLISIVLLGGGVLVLAGMAIQKDKTDVALTIIGYLLTFLGGVGTGQSINRRPA